MPLKPACEAALAEVLRVSKELEEVGNKAFREGFKQKPRTQELDRLQALGDVLLQQLSAQVDNLVECQTH